MIGGLLGTMMVFYFTGLAVAAVASAAQEVVLEVRRQLRENPDIMTYKSKPDYRSCVALVTQAALKELRYPGSSCLSPLLVSISFC